MEQQHEEHAKQRTASQAYYIRFGRLLAISIIFFDTLIFSDC